MKARTMFVKESDADLAKAVALRLYGTVVTGRIDRALDAAHAVMASYDAGKTVGVRHLALVRSVAREHGVAAQEEE